ncbi:TonB-dependent receptor plug domain-containing protein [Pacificimonas flava]|uniref:TonB-dependent receptor n=1 Tax=Pacificimonas flava TaxID=1234595 RepID=M2SAY4_9SPHN|nr:TonB-dependent receptor [Pacificimonas flava]EMD82550.1 TonB-dependent receptor [Pacificimonas flava]MBB5281379.1 outer membrane receptor protein involved in Fe transport [Pacificimonas flava]
MRSTILSTGAMLAAWTASAAAQAQDVAAPASPPAAMSDVIVVTGSRLTRTDLDAPSPITTVGEQALDLSGNFTIENTLNEFPQLAGGNNSSVNSGGGSGVLTANLRGLGATRTLVLVNGRRFIPANADGVVDLSSVPDALIERVDIITGGASAVYGSDAIAGAVNFVLKEDYEGFEANYMYGINEEGDGISHKADVTFGADLNEGRGNVTMSLSYTTQDPVFQEDRDFSAPPLDTVNGELVPGGSGNVPGTRIGLSAGTVAGLTGVAAPSGDCSSITGIYFGEGGQPTTYCTPQDAFDYAEGNYLLRPLERTQITALGHYDVTDNVTAYAEGYFMTNRNEYQQASSAFSPVTPSIAGGNTLLLPNYATNPVLSDPVRDFFVSNANIFDPDGDGDAEIVGAGRRANELGPRNYAFERTSYDLTGGFRGDFDVMDRNWRWDAFFQYQRTRTDQLQTGQISSARLSQALNATTDADGNIVCVDPSRGCVPVSIFGFDSITPEAGAFISPDRADFQIFDRMTAGASISGELFDLPAGPVAIALGTEYRKDDYEFTPSPQDAAGEYGNSSQSATSGDFDVREIFGEVRVPILDSLPWADTLALEGAARLSDYSTIGSVFTWKLGGEYAPTYWLRFRGAYNQAIRAPNLNELYAPVSFSYTGGNDPCAAAENPTDAQKQFCVAQGVPASDIDNFAQGTVGYTVRTGGNPNLEEETSSTYTIGAVIQPDFVASGLNIAIDYFNVEVDDVIATINGDQTLRDCFRRLDASAATCQAVNRLSNGQIDFIETNLLNLGALKVNGLDAQVDYALDLPAAVEISGPATLGLQVVGSWLFERSLAILDGEEPLDCAGIMGGGCGGGTGAILIPDFKLNISANYASGPLSFRAQARMIDGFDLNPDVSAAVEDIPAEWYVDLFAKYGILENLEIFGGINNLTDNKPTVLGTALAGDANVDVGLYDVLGRRYVMGARLHF